MGSRVKNLLGVIFASTVMAAGMTACAASFPQHGRESAEPSGPSPVVFAGPSYAFVNGRWFNGTSFDRKTFYSTNGLFTDRQPARIDSTVDLH